MKRQAGPTRKGVEVADADLTVVVGGRVLVDQDPAPGNDSFFDAFNFGVVNVVDWLTGVREPEPPVCFPVATA